VPLIVHHPRAPHTWGVHTKSLVEHVDLYPTIAELAGVPVTAAAHESIEGDSYASLFAAGAQPATTVWTNAFNASFTQYPRCGETIGKDGTPGFKNAIRCAQVDKTDFVYMGYSMRTERWRYTEWAEWDGDRLRPKWTDSVTADGALVELYDHQGDSLAEGAVGQKTWDDFENQNVAAAHSRVVLELSQRIRAFYDRSAFLCGKSYGQK
jgi:iduronate 2-sulfatase